MNKRFVRLGLIAVSILALAACNQLPTGGNNDSHITEAVQSRLFQDPVLKTRNIQVASNGGTVTLTGSVNSELEKNAAEGIVSQVSGVKRVIDQLAVTQASADASAAVAPAEASPDRMPATSARSKRERASLPRRTHQDRQDQVSQPGPPPDGSSSAQTAAASTPTQPSAPATPPPPPPPVQLTIPAGTVLTVRMIDTIDSSKAQAGQQFAASISSPVVVNGQVAIPQGSDAKVRVVQQQSAGHIKGRSELQVELVSLNANGTDYDVKSGYYTKQGASRGTRSAETIGGGAGLGALIGGLIGHGKGAAIGAIAGAGAGTAAQEATKAPPVVIASETKVDFTLKSPLTITLPAATQ